MGLFSKKITLDDILKALPELSDEEIYAYIATNDPFDKAGSYGIQGIFSKHIGKIEGCYFNVVGLPTNALSHLFKKATGESI